MSTLLLSDDLIFTSRVRGTGLDLGVPVEAVRTAEQALQFARRAPPACVIVDLAHPGLEIAKLAAELKSLAPEIFVVAYGPHVETAALQTARDAGCDLVMTRSKFVVELPAGLRGWNRLGEPA